MDNNNISSNGAAAVPDPSAKPVAVAAESQAAPLNVDAAAQDPSTKPQDVSGAHEPHDKIAQESLAKPASTTESAAANEAAPAADAPDGSRGPELLSVDDSKPEDFEGEVATNDELPSAALIKQIENYIVLDKHGKSHTFKSLYSGRNVSRRVLVLFVRHFFCGNCQDYLRTLCESITPDALLQLPVSTFVTVIGCGDPALIDMYTEATGCTFPIYTDPTRSLFQALEMTKTWTPGPKPAYVKRGMAKNALESLGQALKTVTGGLVLKSGNFAQVGGEFLFEPLHIETPISTPQEERHRPLDDGKHAVVQLQEDEDRSVEEKRVTWCHRMRTTRDHVEIPEMMEILGLGGHGRPSTDEKRWARAISARKGTGLSMASQMSQLSNRQAEPAA